MTLTDPYLTVPSGRLEAFCRKWRIRELSLFGSVIRGEHGPHSDVDVLVEMLPDSQLGWNWADMRDELAGILGREVDLVFKDALRTPSGDARS